MCLTCRFLWPFVRGPYLVTFHGQTPVHLRHCCCHRCCYCCCCHSLCWALPGPSLAHSRSPAAAAFLQAGFANCSCLHALERTKRVQAMSRLAHDSAVYLHRLEADTLRIGQCNPLITYLRMLIQSCLLCLACPFHVSHLARLGHPTLHRMQQMAAYCIGLETPTSSSHFVRE